LPGAAVRSDEDAGEAMAFWLMKSEPGTWSWDDQAEAGTAEWDGVRNAQALNNMKAMKRGERAFFYHSGAEKRIVGVVAVVREYYPDPTDPLGRAGMVDVEAVTALKKPVALAQIKADPRLQHLPLVRQSRLSVSPVDARSWALICGMGGIAA
jgi:predicted RNA-binding protein with PUA-like domain